MQEKKKRKTQGWKRKIKINMNAQKKKIINRIQADYKELHTVQIQVGR